MKDKGACENMNERELRSALAGARFDATIAGIQRDAAQTALDNMHHMVASLHIREDRLRDGIEQLAWGCGFLGFLAIVGWGLFLVTPL
jgi:hypothetical protein